MSRDRSRNKQKRERYFDYNLLFVTVFLCCFGLVMLYSSSYYIGQLKNIGGAFYVKKQIRNLLIGFAVMLFVSVMDYHLYARLWPLAWLGSTAMMFLVDFTPFGVEYNGSKRWFGYRNHAICQPAELVKIALILTMAALIVKYVGHLTRSDAILRILGYALIPIALVAKNNLSSGIIIGGIVAAMFFVATRERRLFLRLAGLVALVAFSAVMLADRLVETGILEQYQVSRILVWQNPAAYPKNGGWQVLQGLYAIGSGGVFGKGLGNSVQKLGFVPEAENDMIFSIICEELGLFGAVCVILLFLFMLYRFLVIANNAPDLLGSMLVVGVMAQIALQVFLNIAVVTNFIPNTGVSLPLISYGGTSLVFLMAEIGMALGVSRKIRLD